MTIDPRIQDEPHEKPQMPSRLARIVERASYRDICLFTLAVWIASAVLLDIAPQGHGIIHSNNSDPSFLDALYFVIVTLSSLGYGDYTPVGFGRVVAGCLVLYGLGAVALFIGKLASERAQAMVLLLHTSDRDRRLRGFEREIIDANQSIQDAVAASNKQLLISTLRGLTGLLEGVSNYIAF
ncbi:MAG: potassium channel family protein, partial [bacterium]